ncbi:hypothetical protein GCM10010406_19310 [Streptomyces thermolineatus]|uniref:Uncharacterized protein n=1 Tax=Streptomyces thermolineatus TaxID=44033 RepID=A0ABN3LEZ4_9ACTN
MLPGPDTGRGQVVGQPVGPGVELGVGEAVLLAHHGRPVGDGGCYRFEDMGEIEEHGGALRKGDAAGRWCGAAQGFMSGLEN